MLKRKPRASSFCFLPPDWEIVAALLGRVCNPAGALVTSVFRPASTFGVLLRAQFQISGAHGDFNIELRAASGVRVLVARFLPIAA